MRALAATLSIVLVLAACGADEPVADTPVAEASPIDEGSSPSPDAATSPDAPSPTDEASPAPSPTPEPSPRPPSAAPGFASVPSDSVVLPTGLFAAGLSPDGTRLHADGPHPDGVGCEESEPYALQLFDLATGEVTLDLDPSLGLFGPFRGPDDLVLLTLGCEGFLGRVVVGRELPDGRITDLVEVPIPTTEGPFSDATAVDWTPDGDLVWIVLGGGADLVTTDLIGAETRDRVALNREYYLLGATSTEVWAVEYGEGGGASVIGLRSGDRIAGYDDLAAAPELDAVLALGDAGVRLLRGDGSQAIWISDPVGDDVGWRGATLAGLDLAYAIEDRSQPPDFASDRALHAITPDGIVETIDVGADSVPGPMLSADGDRLVYVVYDEGSDTLRTIIRDRV